MKIRFTIKSICLIALLSYSFIFSQSTIFSISEYSKFLNSHQNLSSKELFNLYNAGEFLNNIPNETKNILYQDSVEIKYNLTSFEKELLKKNGFVVTERITKADIREMFLDVWSKDLPVYISTDAILHAFHRSYDRILKTTETSYIIPQLKNLLSELHKNLSVLDKNYGSDTNYTPMLKDIDLYLTIPRKIMDVSIQPYYKSNTSKIDEIFSFINSLSFIEKPLFSSTNRKIDYSQFKPRGHYTDSDELSNYFKAMIWLGRIELYLIKPVEDNLDSPTFQDIQRQIIDTYLIHELMDLSGMLQAYNELEKVISSFVGEQDNVTITQAGQVFEAVKIKSVGQLMDSIRVAEFQDTLSLEPFSEQRILSQLLYSDPKSPYKIKPASAFMLFGQRFVVDSYVTGSVVYDKIDFNGTKITRMLPSTLDILFALGNSAAGQLLSSELNTFHYSSNLASLRYLIDSYGNDFWQSSIYNLWLNSLKSLNPPLTKNTLPSFMQTAAWWQHKINGQLSSWTELRHDNILYAKQSYTGMVSCSYPYGYVEPVPEFFKSMATLANKSIEKFSGLALDLSASALYFRKFAEIMDTLKSISEKELAAIEFTKEEKSFLKKVLYKDPMCGPFIDGWYFDLWFMDPGLNGFPLYTDYITADYHTAPTDENGSIVGWVKHAGTGPINLMVVNADLPGIGTTTFVGPVCSYYEFTTTNFMRLNDTEWKETYLNKASRPDWVNIYLADKNGNSRGIGSQLITDVVDNSLIKEQIPENFISAANYPNPFNPETIISFTIPSRFSSVYSEVNIYNIQGELIKKVFSGNVQGGTYLTKWHGENEYGILVSSGIYLYEIKAGDLRTTGKMNLLK